MPFPQWPTPSNWLSIIIQYHAYAYTDGDVYSYTGDISDNSELSWNAVTWMDARDKPPYSLFDAAFKQEAFNAMGGYFSSTNFYPDHAQIAANTSSISTLNTSVSGLSSSVGAKVPNTRTVNGHALSADVTVTANDLSLATVASSGSYADLSNKPSIPSVVRTSSSLSLSLVGSGATGTQIHATKDSSVRCNISTSTTSTIGGASVSAVALKICATNSATEGDWTTIAIIENDQTLTLALALQSIQVVKGQINADVPGGWYVKLVNSGSGTHTETSISGQKTIYG